MASPQGESPVIESGYVTVHDMMPHTISCTDRTPEPWMLLLAWPSIAPLL